MNPEWLNAFWGGVLLGTAVSLMLLWNGRVTGIAGIVNGLLTPLKGDTLWRLSFLGGMLTGGLTLKLLYPRAFNSLESEPWKMIVAGLLVGFGTVLGSGCTSGHGVCGISRLSPRSLIATLVFMLTGITVVYLFRIWGQA